MTIIDAVAIIVIVVLFLLRTGYKSNMESEAYRLEKLGFTKYEIVQGSELIAHNYRMFKRVSLIQRVLLIGYAGSWVVTWLS